MKDPILEAYDTIIEEYTTSYILTEEQIALITNHIVEKCEARNRKRGNADYGMIEGLRQMIPFHIKKIASAINRSKLWNTKMHLKEY